MDENLSKLDESCRLCLSKNELYNIFFTKNKKGVTWADMVVDCLSLDVSCEDGLPPWLCKKCSTKLNSFFIFKAKCKQTVEKLIKHVALEYESQVKVEDHDFASNLITEENEQFLIKEESCSEHEIKVEDIATFSSSDDNYFFVPGVHEAEESPMEVKEEASSMDIISELKHKNTQLSLQWESCKECGEEFNSKFNYVKHLINRHEKGEYKCECGDTFKFVDALTAHKNNDHGRLYSCHFCPRFFLRKDKAVEHMNRHISGKVVKPIKRDVKITEVPTLLPGQKFCSVCKLSFSTRTLLLDHITYRHLGHKYYCEICEKSYCSEVRHKQKAHGSWNECKDCKQKFARKILYLEHVKNTHKQVLEGKRHICHCGAQFGFIKEFRKHKYRIHNEAAFMCDVCSKGFMRKDKMKDHVLAHRRERRFPCLSCDKVFFTRDVLRKHRQTHMKGRFICDYCGQQFKTRSTIFSHITRHDPNHRPYACPICGKSFRRSDHRNIHLKQVHKHSPL